MTQDQDQVSPVSASFHQEALRISAIAVAYFLAHDVAFLFPDSALVLAAFWPAGGIGLAALLLCPRRLWPAILVALFVTGNAANLLHGRPLLNSLGFMTANTLESLSCAWLIIRVCGEDVRFTRMREIFVLIVAAVFVNACTGLIGAGTAALASSASFSAFWFTWWVADGLGILLLSPLIVSCFGHKRHSTIRADSRMMEWCGFMAVWLIVSWLVFNPKTFYNPNVPPLHPYMILALIAWPALRLGFRSVAWALVILATVAVTSSSVVTDPTLWIGPDAHARLLEVQLFLMFAATTGFLLATSRSEGEAAEYIAQEGHDRLRKMATALHEERQCLKSIIDGTHAGIWAWQIQTGELEINETGAHIIGYTLAELSPTNSETFAKHTHPDDVQESTNLLERHLAGKTPHYECESRMRHKDGRWVWVHIWGRLQQHSADGRPTLIFGTIVDITDRKRAAAAIDRDLSILSTAISQSPTGHLMADPFFRVTEVNASACQILAMSSDTIIGQDLLGLLLGTALEQWRETALSGIAGESRWVHQLEVPTQDDRGRWLDLLVIPVRCADGEILGYAASIRDITSIKQLEFDHQRRTAELMQASRMASLGVLAAGIGHEISNPANFIAINVPLLKTYWQDAMPVLDAQDARTPDFVLGRTPWPQVRGLVPTLFDGIETGLDRIRGVLAGMRDFAIPDPGPHQAVDLNAVAEAAVALTRHALDGATTRLSVGLQPGLPHVLGSFQRLEQVLVNLLLNACQALPSNSRAIAIVTRLDQDANRVLIIIADEGIGIPATELPNLGEPFRTTRRSSGGTGLGLSIVQRIIADHNGSLDISSRPDHGTTVTVSLPILTSGGVS